MSQQNLIRMYESSFRAHRELPALTDYFKGQTFSYYEMAKEIAKLHMLFTKAGIKKGDNIALVGRNNPRWVITYIATMTYGAVIVPILQEFNGNDINHIINHSESRLLFAGEQHWDVIDANQLKNIKAVFSLGDFRCIYERNSTELTRYQENILSHYRSAYPKGFSTEDIRYDDIPGDAVTIINYTSGTTGFSKGVMLTVNNITGNVGFALSQGFHYPASRVLCMLPLAHSYGCAFDMLTALAAGSHVTLLGRLPAPKIIVEAMQQVRPNVVCMVPVVMEKLIRRQVSPMLDRKSTRMFSKIPLADGVVNGNIRKKMIASFGGEVTGVIIGGAAANADMEDFLQRIRFPYTVGYGMTECGPLVSYSPPEDYKPGTCGRILPNMEAAIESSDPQNVPGEILLRGEHVMKGYYKNGTATAAAFNTDGWLRTGDVGTIAADGTLHIRGRKRSMILLGNGQNIYPEEIESKLNVMDCVMESLVVERDGKLVALVVPDYEQADSHGISVSGIKEVMRSNLSALNTQVAGYEQLSDIILYPEEFEKTPQRSIKRFIYTG